MPRNKRAKKNSASKVVAYVLATVIAITGGGAGGFFLYGANHASELDTNDIEIVENDFIEPAETVETIEMTDGEMPIVAPDGNIEGSQTQDAVDVQSESYSQSESQVYLNGAPVISKAVINDSLKKLYINASSIEKDLKIKIEDDTRTLVGGQKFVVYVDKTTDKASGTVARGNSDAPANGVKTPGAALAAQKASAAGTNGTRSWVAQPSTDVSSIYTSAAVTDAVETASYSGTAYTDEDGDGVIYIKNLDGGNYRLTLEALSGYYTADATGVFNVKDKIEYKAVDVKDQIKKENQVDVAKEEGGKTGAATEEVAVTDASQLEVEESNADVSTISRSELSLPKASADGESNATLEANFVVIETSGINVSKRNAALVATGETQVEPSNPDGTSGVIDNASEGENKPAGDNTTEQPQAQKHEVDASTWEYDKNYHWNKCSVEGCHEENKVTHEFGEWVITLPATTTLTGTRERVCSVCGYKETEEIEKLIASEVDSSKKGSVSIPGSATLYASTIDGVGTLSIPVTQTGDLVTDIYWESSDSSVVSVSGDKTTAKLSANSVGSARITAAITYIKSKEADGTNTTDKVTICCDVTVKPLSDSDALKDNNGTTVYIDKSLKTEAKQSDIEKYDTFYAGKLSAVYGIDVSKYNGTVNWAQVANQGMHFAIIRAGYRGYGSGVLVEDSQFRANMAGATKAGMKVGVYFFSQAVTEAEAVEEASMVVSMVSGYGVSYPIFIDSEYANGSHTGRADGLSKDARTAITRAFCNTIQNSGYKAGVYASKTWFSEHLNASALSGYYIWVAQYNTSCTYGGKYNLWQYTMKGSCAGVSGKVDVNVSYMGY